MKILNIVKKIFLILFGLYSFSMILTAKVVLAASSNFTILENARYAFLLLLSVVYLHIGIQSYLAPLYKLNKIDRKEISGNTFPYLSKGIVGLGYFIVITFSLSFLNIGPVEKPPDSYLFIGIFLIGLGILEKTRAVVIVLFEKNKLLTNIEKKIS